MSAHVDLDGLADLLVGEGADADAEHLAGCAACSDELLALEQAQDPVRAALAGLPQPQPPAGFADRLDTALRAAGPSAAPASRSPASTAAARLAAPAQSPGDEPDTDDDARAPHAAGALSRPAPVRPLRPRDRRPAPDWLLRGAATAAGLLVLAGGVVLLGQAARSGGEQNSSTAAGAVAPSSAAALSSEAAASSGGGGQSSEAAARPPAASPRATAASPTATAAGPPATAAGPPATNRSGLDYATDRARLTAALPVLLRGGATAAPGTLAPDVARALEATNSPLPSATSSARLRPAAPGTPAPGTPAPRTSGSLGPRAVAPSAGDQVPPAEPDVSAQDPLQRLRDPVAAQACLSALPSGPRVPLALDYASYAGRPALVAVLPAPVPNAVDVVALGLGCRTGDPQLLSSTRLPRP